MEIIRSRGKRGSGLWGLTGHEAGQANRHVDQVQIRVLFSPRVEPRGSDIVDPKTANDPQPRKNSCSVCGRAIMRKWMLAAMWGAGQRQDRDHVCGGSWESPVRSSWGNREARNTEETED